MAIELPKVNITEELNMEPQHLKQIMHEWADALISGQYQQAKGALCTTEGTPKYCCLGVLCEIAIKHGIDLTKSRTIIDRFEKRDDDSPQIMGMAYNDSTLVLPLAVREWLNVEEDIKLVYEGSLKRATVLNDNFPLTFPEIAAAIRKTYPPEPTD